ncbi:MAG: LacI family DNA-binding transcriptional regulator [Clostridium sp.]|uniref:LacI family DNA-binding transcriptional regulator n=1 Tax=Clostridium sp. TaxID=1506 RepID=UPI0030738CCC
MSIIATIKEVAAMAGVSMTTVSRVLNFDEGLNVSPDTKKKIFEVAEKLKYVSGKQKRAKEKYFNIGIVNWYTEGDEIRDPYFLSIRMAVEGKCNEENINFTYINFNRDKQYKDIDGIVAIGKFGEEEIQNIRRVSDKIVFIDSSPSELEYDSVVIDYEGGVTRALSHLYDEGHRNIGFIGGEEYVSNGKEKIIDQREKTYKKFMESINNLKDSNIYLGEFLPEHGYKLMKMAMEEKEIPTAFFIASDPMAIGAYRAALESGYKIPEDISIIGFDDIYTSQFLTPALTTVKVYTDFMGKVAVETLMGRLKCGSEVCRKVVIPTKLIVRESTKKL